MFGSWILSLALLANASLYTEHLVNFFLAGGDVFTGGMICDCPSARLESVFMVLLSEFSPSHDFFLSTLRAMIPLLIISFCLRLRLSQGGKVKRICLLLATFYIIVHYLLC